MRRLVQPLLSCQDVFNPVWVLCFLEFQLFVHFVVCDRCCWVHLQIQKLKGHCKLQHCKNHMYKQTNEQNTSFRVSCLPRTSFSCYLCPWRQSLEECLSAQRTCGFVARCEPFILWNEKKWKQTVSEEREAFEIIQGCTFSGFWNICRIGVINDDRLRTSLQMGNDKMFNFIFQECTGDLL